MISEFQGVSKTSQNLSEQQFSSLQKNFNAWSQQWFERDINQLSSPTCFATSYEEFTAIVDDSPVMSIKCIQDELIKFVSNTIFLANKNNINGVIEILLSDLISRAGLFPNSNVSVFCNEEESDFKNISSQKGSFKLDFMEISLLN